VVAIVDVVMGVKIVVAHALPNPERRRDSAAVTLHQDVNVWQVSQITGGG
jgi:hypothetical protein